jgi:hypothetical protein
MREESMMMEGIIMRKNLKRSQDEARLYGDRRSHYEGSTVPLVVQ